MELLAVIEALKALKQPCSILVVTDSSYVANAINGWLAGWIKKELRGVKNPDLWSAYVEAAKPHVVKAQWVRGHNGHPQNEECDLLARQEAEKFQREGGKK